MTQDYSSEAAAVADALNAVYENKQVNKKDDISGDFSSDTASYPTVKAVKSLYGTKVNSWSSTVSDSNIPSEKLVKDSLDGKQATLVSGTNIKTINNESLLGSGNISITTGDISLIEVVQSLPSASSSTMNKLYLVPESTSATQDNYEVYVTVRTGSSGSYSYAWEKIDTARIDLSGYINTAGTGLSKSGTTLNHSNSITAVTTAAFKKFKFDAQGHITGTANVSASDLPSHTHDYTTASDVESEIGAFAAALAEAINPSS